MKNITISKNSTVKANGTRGNGNCKPVYCITTGEVYASAIDAAEQLGVSQSVISLAITGKVKTVKGKRYCLVSNVIPHLEEIAENTRRREEKVAKYDKIVETQQRKQALADRKAKLAAMQAKMEKEAMLIAQEEAELEEV